jgi:hypothetical protein
LTKKVNISIPKPCHENWEAMTPEDKGRFCSVCSKTVFDFTKASDKEIIEHLNNDATTCGRFVSSQLNRDLIVSKEKSSYWIIATATVFSFLGIGSHTVHSQVKTDTIKTDKKTINLETTKTEINHRKIRGIVSDEFGPIAGANVIVKGSTRGTTTDFDGNFEIEANEKEVLIFTYTGKKTLELIVSNKSEYFISMSEEVILLAGEVVYVGLPGIKKRTFFGRQIQKIRNWFR